MSSEFAGELLAIKSPKTIKEERDTSVLNTTASMVNCKLKERLWKSKQKIKSDDNEGTDLFLPSPLDLRDRALPIH